MTFVDGGANDGIYSLFAARRVGPGGAVLAVEPSGREHRRLLANLERNPDMRVIPVRAALGRAPGEALLAVAEVGHEGQNTIGESVSNPKVATAKHETVPMTTLDGLVEEHGLARVDVVKLDVEGSEVDALLGARKTIERFHPVIQIEAETERLASQGRTKDELRQLPRRARLRAVRLRRGERATQSLARPPDEPEGNAVAVPRGWTQPRYAP